MGDVEIMLGSIANIEKKKRAPLNNKRKLEVDEQARCGEDQDIFAST